MTEQTLLGRHCRVCSQCSESRLLAQEKVNLAKPPTIPKTVMLAALNILTPSTDFQSAA